MIRNVLTAIATATRALLRGWPAGLVMLVLYAALIATVVLFFSTREATLGQVVLSFLLPPFALILFFVLQTMAARFGVESSVAKLFKGSLRDFWSLVLICIPLVAIGWLIVYVAGLVGDSFKATGEEAVRNLPAVARNAARPRESSVPWQVTLTATLEYVLLLIALPLVTIQLWLATARAGIKAALKSSGRLITRAFAPGSVLVYVLGFVVFAVIPYFLLFTRTPSSNAWVDAGLFAARLLSAALLFLFGWVVTVSALGELRSGDSTAGELNQGAEHAPVATP
jgi:hypothetical protein